MTNRLQKTTPSRSYKNSQSIKVYIDNACTLVIRPTQKILYMKNISIGYKKQLPRGAIKIGNH